MVLFDLVVCLRAAGASLFSRVEYSSGKLYKIGSDRCVLLVVEKYYVFLVFSLSARFDFMCACGLCCSVEWSSGKLYKIGTLAAVAR